MNAMNESEPVIEVCKIRQAMIPIQGPTTVATQWVREDRMHAAGLAGTTILERKWVSAADVDDNGFWTKPTP